MTEGWVCSSCGGTWVTLSLARPSLDERYAVGYCTTCAPPPPDVPSVDPGDTRPKAKPLPTVPLVRADKWDPTTIKARKQRVADAEFLEKVRTGKLLQNIPEHSKRVRTLLARYEDERAARHDGQ